MHDTQARTDCKQIDFEFQGLGTRKVVADFSGGHLSSDGGCLLLREVDRHLGLSKSLADCFTDSRNPELVEHQLPALLSQRVYGLALGYEDVNDHDRLRLDPLFATACGREDVLGEQRRHEEDRGKPLAGKSTLNRLELGARETEGHYRKIQADADKIEDLLVDIGVKSIPRKTGSISMQPTTGSTATRKINISTVTTRVIATCHCTPSAATSRYGPSCARPTAVPTRELLRPWKKSCA